MPSDFISRLLKGHLLRWTYHGGGPWLKARDLENTQRSQGRPLHNSHNSPSWWGLGARRSSWNNFRRVTYRTGNCGTDKEKVLGWISFLGRMQGRTSRRIALAILAGDHLAADFGTHTDLKVVQNTENRHPWVSQASVMSALQQLGKDIRYEGFIRDEHFGGCLR